MNDSIRINGLCPFPLTHINHIGKYDASNDDNCNACFDCDLDVTHEQLGYLGPYLFTDMSQIKTMLRNEVSLAGGGRISGYYCQVFFYGLLNLLSTSVYK